MLPLHWYHMLVSFALSFLSLALMCLMCNESMGTD